MPLEETEPIYQKDKDHPEYSMIIHCDLCNLFIYYNRILDRKIKPELQKGVYMCADCARKIAISDLKALSLDD